MWLQTLGLSLHVIQNCCYLSVALTLNMIIQKYYLIEISTLTLQILQEVEEHGIRIYEFPDCDSEEDEDFKQQDRELKVEPGLA